LRIFFDIKIEDVSKMYRRGIEAVHCKISR
jgi:hypothetical protein